jgi:hypothetical protein
MRLSRRRGGVLDIARVLEAADAEHARAMVQRLVSEVVQRVAARVSVENGSAVRGARMICPCCGICRVRAARRDGRESRTSVPATT